MKKLLVVIDMQNDFIDGALGTKEAEAIVDNVVAKIQKYPRIVSTLPEIPIQPIIWKHRKENSCPLFIVWKAQKAGRSMKKWQRRWKVPSS